MSSPFDSIFGNEPIKKFLLKIAENRSIPNSLLFTGPKGAGKTFFAEAFAKLIVKTENAFHPDIHHYRPEGKIGLHSIQSMRQFCKAVYLASFSGGKKVFIIHEAHRMLSYSANALLKTFEEPEKESVIILITSAKEQLLPTVLSRCQAIRFQLARKNPSFAEGSEQLEESGKSNLRKKVLSLISTGQLNLYPHVLQVSKEIGEEIESSQAKEEAALKADLLQAFKEPPTASAKQMIEKEVEGALSLKKTSIAAFLFNVILSWYRDLQLLLVSENEALLMNPDYKENLMRSLQKGEILSIEEVEKAVSEASLALERSISLNLCLENLFLKLMEKS